MRTTVQTTAIDHGAGIINPNDRAGAYFGGMDCVGLAGLRPQRNDNAAPEWVRR